MISEATFDELVKITVKDGTILTGQLTIPRDCKAIIIFSHGSGSGYTSPRNKQIAQELQKEKFATLLIDLLTPEESKSEEHLQDIDILTERLVSLRDWVDLNPYTEALYMGIIGTSSGAAAALKAAAISKGKINSILSRGGRLDLVMSELDQVKVPVLLLVGSKDKEIADINRKALEHLSKDSELKIIEGAGHNFEEPGKLEEVGSLAVDWFLKTI